MSFRTAVVSMCRPFHAHRIKSSVIGGAAAALGTAQLATIHHLATHSIEPVSGTRVVITGLVALLGVMTAVAANIGRSYRIESFEQLGSDIGNADDQGLRRMIPAISKWLFEIKHSDLSPLAGGVKGLLEYNKNDLKKALQERIADGLENAIQLSPNKTRAKQDYKDFMAGFKASNSWGKPGAGASGDTDRWSL